MQPTKDQFGNYQSSLAGNGIYASTTFGSIIVYEGFFNGGVPTFTPVGLGALALDGSTGTLWQYTNGSWGEVTGGGSSTLQVLENAAADPNVASILPSNQNLAAIYKQDPANGLTNLWFWSTTQKTWSQYSF